MDLSPLKFELQRRTLTIRYPDKLAAYMRPKLTFYDFSVGMPHSPVDKSIIVYKPWSAIQIQDLEYIKEIKELWGTYVEDSTN